jgi:hypothetical protein
MLSAAAAAMPTPTLGGFTVDCDGPAAATTRAAKESTKPMIVDLSASSPEQVISVITVVLFISIESILLFTTYFPHQVFVTPVMFMFNFCRFNQGSIVQGAIR